MTTLRIGIVDSGVNAWHSHVRGAVGGCALEVAPDGRIVEHDDYRDRSGHGTAIAGVIREGLADARLYAVRVFDDALAAYPSVVARGILRAAAEGCDFINLSVAIPPGPGGEALEAACAAAIEAGSVLVACAPPGREGWLPAALPGIHGVIANITDDTVQVKVDSDLTLTFERSHIAKVAGDEVARADPKKG